MDNTPLDLDRKRNDYDWCYTLCNEIENYNHYLILHIVRMIPNFINTIHGMSQNGHLTTFLFEAVLYRSFSTIKILLENGANPNLFVKNPLQYGEPDSTAFHFLISETCTIMDKHSDTEKIIKLFMEYKADPIIKNSEGYTVIDIAKQKNLKIFENYGFV